MTATAMPEFRQNPKANMTTSPIENAPSSPLDALSASPLATKWARVLGPDTRGRLLTGTMAAILDKGPESMTVQDILTYGGRSRRTFYQFFKDKEDAMNGLWKVAVNHALSEVRGALKEPSSPRAKVEMAIAAYLNVVAAGGPVLMALIRESQRPNARLAFHRERAIVGLCDAVNEALALGQSADLTLRGLFIGIEGIVLHAEDHLGGFETNQPMLTEHVTDFFLQGLGIR